MATRNEDKRKKLLKQTIFYGTVSAALYAVVFGHAGQVAELFARGGYYAALPVATVFVFSFAHGTFASKLWTVLGIEAETKRAAKRPTVEAPRPAPRPRARIHMNV